MLSNAIKHFITITKHKFTVMGLLFRIGLIKQGILHDLSKYTPEEFMTGVRYYQGYRSPNAAEKLDKGYSAAWLHHKGRNKHHFEYWIDYGLDPTEGLVGMKMPLRYVLEMICDRIAASKVYAGKEYTTSVPWDYYEQRETKSILMHVETRLLMEKLLMMNKTEGEERTLAFMRYLRKNSSIYDGRVYRGEDSIEASRESA